jgi:hypothetical protein
MKKAYALFAVLLVVSTVSNLNLVSSSASVRVNWALLISGTNEIWSTRTREPLCDCYYMFHLLTSHWGVPRDHIKFLDINPTDAQYGYVPPGTIDDNCRNYSNVKTAIDWLKARSTSSDNVLIFIASHGGGYSPGMSLEQSGGRVDVSGDEGGEVWDGSKWYGVDECIVFKDDYVYPPVLWQYWDDDFKTDLTGMSCNKLTIVLMSCFSGGFIDDLSAPNRIIITSSKETAGTHTCGFGVGFTPFIGCFLDAFNGDVFHRYHAVWNTSDVNRIVDTYEITVPDGACDGVDWRDAYAYARDQYPGDSPWFDSNGNGLPTYKDGQDYTEHFLYVWHTYGGYTTPDTGGYEYPEGTTVNVYETPCIAGYYFAYWLPDDIPWWYSQFSYYPTWNPYTYTMDKDHAIGAYFYLTGGVNGGDGCPTLFVWNGTAYVDYGVINIHNPTGEDVIREVSVKAEDVSINSCKAKFRLREGWPGLNFSESVIDQVKLYAVDSQGNRYLCPLVKAEQSRLGNVLPQLIASDDVKTQILLLETIDLTFIVPYPTIQTQSYVFLIEGCNRFKQ